MTETFVDRFGITRDQLREIVARRQREVIAREQAERDEELLRLGREFRQDGHQSAPPCRQERAVKRQQGPIEPPLIETEGCAAYQCTNKASVVVETEFSGRRLRVRYCPTHGVEAREDAEAA